jgi:hypothetical protein
LGSTVSHCRLCPEPLVALEFTFRQTLDVAAAVNVAELPGLLAKRVAGGQLLEWARKVLMRPFIRAHLSFCIAAEICAFWLTSASCQEAAKQPKLNSEVARCRLINNEHMRTQCFEQINSKAAPSDQSRVASQRTGVCSLLPTQIVVRRASAINAICSTAGLSHSRPTSAHGSKFFSAILRFWRPARRRIQGRSVLGRRVRGDVAEQRRPRDCPWQLQRKGRLV